MRWVAHILILGSLGGCGSELGGDVEIRRGDASDTVEDIEVIDSIDDGDVATDGDEVETGLPDVELDAVEISDTDALDVDANDGTKLDGAETLDTGTQETSEIDAEAPIPWRSALYPSTWTPGFGVDGATLQDYSFAGYHNGARALGDGIGAGGSASLATFDVTTFGAIPVSSAAAAGDSTGAFQGAIDAAEAAGGGIVFVPEGIYRIDRWLEIKSSRIVIRGEGPTRSKLWFTRVRSMTGTAHIRFEGAEEVTDEVAVVSDAARFAQTIEVADASPFRVGEDVLVGHVVDEAFLASLGMSALWASYLGTWQPFYRRTITGVDRTVEPNRLRLDVPLRADLSLAHQPSVRRVIGTLREVGIEDIGVANATSWVDAWGQDRVHAIAFTHVADGWARNVASWASPGAPSEGAGMGAHLMSGGILVERSKRVTIVDCVMERAQNRGFGDGYLFEVRQSNEILTRDSIGRDGQSNFIASRGFGTSGCVWLRVQSTGGASVPLGPMSDQGLGANNELHTLATANLFDSCAFVDGIDAVNRALVSDGNGHSASECTFWNTSGDELVSLQFGYGYVIGTSPRTDVRTKPRLEGGEATAPEDFSEGLGTGDWLVPSSLYEDQLERRLGR